MRRIVSEKGGKVLDCGLMKLKEESMYFYGF